MYWHYPHGVFQAAVRWNDYKLLYHYETGEVALYNLAKDPSEVTDISNLEPKTTQKTQKMLQEWLVRFLARFPKEGVIIP